MKKILIFTIISVLFYSCSSNDDTNVVNPENIFKVETNSVTNLGHQSANVIGRFNRAFENEVSVYGICYGLSPNPTISGTHTTATNYYAPNENFSSNLSPLSQNTTYYVRAYGTTSDGTFYGDQITFTTLSQVYSDASSVTDVDGNSYPTIIINSKQWMKKNLNVSKYRNGDVIPQVTDLTQWDNLTTGAWCYYANDTANGTVYGKLYNWYAVNDPRGLAPTGWHIPTDQEWTSLTTFLGGTSVAGSKMRDAGALWSPAAAVATNQSGFSALPGGYSYLTTTYTPAGEPFKNIGEVAYWWSTTSSSTNTAYSVNISLTNSLTRSSIRSKAAISVRCVKN
ncbi:fibrobacter succinogenes major paralogous domain-containing protein [Flavobacterium sp. RSB2_4_14]|uniref:fibrobacter succinogenes major paralogous domain-containing protein n=1 Tax=Flavobacterium sp. RSB2_4_14 TaxID=3447665 RepID=UPI003F304215